jgi:hypothetical protein
MRLRNKDAGTGNMKALKFVTGTDGGRRLLECSFCGFVTELGVKWELWSPTGNRLSAIVRKEAPGKRTRFMYDPGNGFRRAVRLAGGHLKRK